MEESSFKLKAQNVTCFDKDVRLLYTGSGINALSYYQNDRQLLFQDMTSDDWGGQFLTASGEVWVADGKTLPYSFNQVAFCTIKFVYGVTLITTSRAFLVGQRIDTFLQLLMQDLVDDIVTALGIPIATAYKLGGASPVGLEMYYSGNTLQMNLLGMQDFAGGGSYQDFGVAGFFSTTSFGSKGLTNSFKLENSIGYNIDIVVDDLTSGNYRELVNSLLDQSILIDRIRKQSNCPEQVLESAVFKKYDISGIASQIADVALIDPYQFQNVIDYSVDVAIDGQTYMEVNVLAGEYITLTFYYDTTAGIVTYEQLKEVDRILREQGIDTSNRAEERELEEAYLNFGGFDIVETKTETRTLTTIILVGILAYVMVKN